MSEKSIYTEIITAKNGTLIPLLSNNRTIESRYNPENSTKSLLNQIKENTGFIILLGLSSGILVDQILKTFPNVKILVLEISKSDYCFLSELPVVKSLCNNQNVIFSTLSSISNDILNNYLPAIYGNLQIIEQLGWKEIHSDKINTIYELIQNSINQIAADYSVQSHFGKIWQTNIFHNFKLSSQLQNKPISIDKFKTAIILAAGPSLDINIRKINPEKHVIFATDTALQILYKYKIKPDFVISIDGQFISYNHFYVDNLEKTHFFFDLCSNFSAAHYIYNKNYSLNYFVSGHPFSELLNFYTNTSFYRLQNGSGTVTITALDLAINLGFTEIEILGADFGYINNKAYSSGSYLDTLYLLNSNRVNSYENNFDHLLFRSELTKCGNKATNKVLDSYKNSMLTFLKNYTTDITYSNNIYFLKLPESIKQNPNREFFDYSIVLKNVINDKENYQNALLPLIAFYRHKDNNLLKFEEYMKLAQSFIVSYNL